LSVTDINKKKLVVEGKGSVNSSTPLKVYLKKCLGSDIYSNMVWVKSEYELDSLSSVDVNKGIVSNVRMNDMTNMNEFLGNLNQTLKIGDYTAVILESKNIRKKRLLKRYPGIVTYPYYLGDFILSWLFPSFIIKKKINTAYKGRKYKIVSLTEGMARLVCAGFQIQEFKHIRKLTCIIAQKSGYPKFDLVKSSNSFIIKVPRIGQDGKILNLYKVRTMYPYAEYLQEYMFDRFGTEDGDKIENDFRITSWGYYLRKYWIDELPMIWNQLKGDLKLVGVRPISKQKYDTYPEYLQKKRIQTKPGLIPPFYADLPQTADEFFETENRYLESYFKNPFRTDFRYFCKAFYNIIFKGQRSR